MFFHSMQRLDWQTLDKADIRVKEAVVSHLRQALINDQGIGIDKAIKVIVAADVFFGVND